MEGHSPESQEGDNLTPFVCSKCSTEVIPEVEPWPEACPTCQRPFDQKAQLAYSRGKDAFTAGQELIIRISPKVRKWNLATDPEMEGIRYYSQAYTALQESFKGDLAESQRHLGIEMMTAIARVFLQHDMISPLESAYWSNLLIEANSQRERKILIDKLATSKGGGAMELIRRVRWKIRLNQLDRGLEDLDVKIIILERNIAFVEPSRARGKKRSNEI
jgi:hypothetical protein